MHKDRTAIVNIISNMLNNPKECEIYSTSSAFAALELYIEKVRMETLGWAISFACNALDDENDIRLMEIPEIIEQARNDLN